MATKSPTKPTPPAKPTPAQLRKQRLLARQRFLRSRAAGTQFTRQLRAVAKQVGVIVKGFAPDGIVRAPANLTAALDRYSQLLKPWAQEVSERMLRDVAAKDENAWLSLAREMGQELRKEVASAPTGQVMQLLMSEQVNLITSLPLKAAQRVHTLTIEAMTTTSTRAVDIAKEILRTGHVTESRAMLIARTEVARTASIFTQSRAEYIGSEGYIWRTVGDSDVRELHRKLEGKLIPWDSPPIAGENGERAHAGQIYNCRCYPEPVLPDVIR